MSKNKVNSDVSIIQEYESPVVLLDIKALAFFQRNIFEISIHVKCSLKCYSDFFPSKIGTFPRSTVYDFL